MANEVMGPPGVWTGGSGSGGGKRPRRSESMSSLSSVDSGTSVASISKTSREAKSITPVMAMLALDKVRYGVVPVVKGLPGYQPNQIGYPCMKNNCQGCWLAQKKPTGVSFY